MVNTEFLEQSSINPSLGKHTVSVFSETVSAERCRAQLSPRNLVDPKKIEVKTADVTIKVSPDRGDLIETRILNGVKYILVRVEEGVEVNGVPVQITE